MAMSPEEERRWGFVMTALGTIIVAGAIYDDWHILGIPGLFVLLAGGVQIFMSYVD